jgi:hypothetical protein
VPTQLVLLSSLEGNQRVNRLRTRYGFEPLDCSSRVLVNLSMTYGIVKLLLPLRIGLSVWLTPYVAGVLTRSLSFVSKCRSRCFRK